MDFIDSNDNDLRKMFSCRIFRQDELLHHPPDFDFAGRTECDESFSLAQSADTTRTIYTDAKTSAEANAPIAFPMAGLQEGVVTSKLRPVCSGQVVISGALTGAVTNHSAELPSELTLPLQPSERISGMSKTQEPALLAGILSQASTPKPIKLEVDETFASCTANPDPHSAPLSEGPGDFLSARDIEKFVSLCGDDDLTGEDSPQKTARPTAMFPDNEGFAALLPLLPPPFTEYSSPARLSGRTSRCCGDMELSTPPKDTKRGAADMEQPSRTLPPARSLFGWEVAAEASEVLQVDEDDYDDVFDNVRDASEVAAVWTTPQAQKARAPQKRRKTKNLKKWRFSKPASRSKAAKSVPVEDCPSSIPSGSEVPLPAKKPSAAPAQPRPAGKAEATAAAEKTKTAKKSNKRLPSPSEQEVVAVLLDIGRRAKRLQPEQPAPVAASTHPKKRGRPPKVRTSGPAQERRLHMGCDSPTLSTTSLLKKKNASLKPSRAATVSQTMRKKIVKPARQSSLLARQRLQTQFFDPAAAQLRSEERMERACRIAVTRQPYSERIQRLKDQLEELEASGVVKLVPEIHDSKRKKHKMILPFRSFTVRPGQIAKFLQAMAELGDEKYDPSCSKTYSSLNPSLKEAFRYVAILPFNPHDGTGSWSTTGQWNFYPEYRLERLRKACIHSAQTKARMKKPGR